MARTSSPTRRSTSDSVRTVVVLPVPPLSDRTAIVSAIEDGHDTARRSVLRLVRAYRRAGHGRDLRCIQVEQRVAPDRDLVAVRQRSPFHPAAVVEDAVQRAVVDHPHALLLV